MSELFRNPLHVGNKGYIKGLSPFFRMTTSHRVENRINEMWGIATELEITSQINSFIE
jgi:hypothetical protein